LPAPVALALWRRRARRQWALPEARERARRAVRIAAADGADLDRLARAHLVENHIRHGLTYRPWQQAGRWLDRGPIDAALATGRGVLASYCHLGPVPGITSSLRAVHPAPCAVVGAWMLSPGDEAGRRWRTALEDQGVTLIRADGGYAEIAEALLAGRVVSMAFDVPGSQPTSFLGRTIELASGTTRAAMETGALVVPVSRSRRAWRTYSTSAPALDPRDFGSTATLQQALADLHTATIRQRPGEIEDPHRAGWWGAQAGGD
jgi:lauroyl/myristoyl acyltransferase